MANFKVGDKVFFYGRPATVKQVIREPDADYILDVQGDEFYAEDDEVTSRNSRACNSANPVVANAMNACGTARNADGDIKQVEKEYTAALRALQELAVKAKSIDPRSRMYQDAVKAGTALYGGMKPNW